MHQCRALQTRHIQKTREKTPLQRVPCPWYSDLRHPGRIARWVACPSAIADTFTGSHAGTKISHNYPIPKGADPFHCHALRVRGGENNVYFAFANVLDEPRRYLGKSAVFASDSFAFPGQESAMLDEEGIAGATVDTTNLDTPYPTNIVRRKDLVVMRQPHHYQPLAKWHQ